MRILLRLAALSLVLFSPACSYQPEDAGQCKLTCGSAIIGGNDLTMSITVKNETPTVACAATAAGMPTGGYRSMFLIGESIKDQAGQEVAVRPVPNISIEPIIIGQRATIENGETDPAYQGIRTPRSNWCSDACGVVSLESVPLCPPPGISTEYSVQVHSGALFSEPAVYEISTEEPDDAGLR